MTGWGDWKEYLTPNRIGSIVTIVTILLVLRYTMQMENIDLLCPNVHCDSSECREGNGMPYAGSAPEVTDTNIKLLDRILIANNADKKTVKWRRSYILAVIITILFFVLVQRRVPEIYEIILTILFAGIVIYFSFSFYDYHHLTHAENNVIKAVEMLRENLVKIESDEKIEINSRQNSPLRSLKPQKFRKSKKMKKSLITDPIIVSSE